MFTHERSLELFDFLKYFCTLLYVVSSVFLCVFGLHRYYLVHLYSKAKARRGDGGKGESWSLPRVTVQLPVYNEMYVAERLIRAVCAIEYPRELLEVQVLDDSTDDTSGIAARCTEELRDAGFDIKHIRRGNREGYKAGALAAGCAQASGDFLAVFDADFVPPKDFLQKTIPCFKDPKVGIVQTRWGHLNLDYSLLTKAQSVLLDGHFVVEQTARHSNGLFLNFNGTAGVIRKKCIELSGGWQHDTLTEDLDLSYRAQINGWRAVYLSDVVSDAELPVDMNAFKIQQHRWVKGGIQTAGKLLPSVLLDADIPFKVKAESIFHLLGNFSYLFLLATIILIIPMSFLWEHIWLNSFFVASVTGVALGTFAIIRFYILAVREAHGPRAREFYKYIPVALGVGAGIAVNNAKAVLEAVLGRASGFARTPKYAVVGKKDRWRTSAYVSSRGVTTFLEVLLSLFFTFQVVYVAYMGFFIWIPFLLLMQFGFTYTAFLSIYHGS